LDYLGQPDQMLRHREQGYLRIKGLQVRTMQGAHDRIRERLIVSHKVQSDTSLDLIFGRIFG
jgi:hypothetical protein